MSLCEACVFADDEGSQQVGLHEQNEVVNQLN